MTARYPIAALADAGNAGDADLAEAFVDVVLSDEGQAVLAQLGFGTP